MTTYVSVVKDSNGDWYVKNTILSVYNVRGNKTGNTYGDITVLDETTRIEEGFWIENDVYVNNGEFTIFDNIVKTFDETNGIVTYTYNFILMPLDDIKTELKSRVQTKLNNMYCGTITFNSTTVTVSYQLRGFLALLDRTNIPSNLVVPIGDGNFMAISDQSTFDSLISAINSYTVDIMNTAKVIFDNIGLATNYTDLRTAATWDGTQL